MSVMDSLSGKKLLITGGTGSFGNAVLRRYLGEELPKMATDDTLYFDKGLLEIIVEAMPKTHAVLDATKRAP